MTVKNNKPFRAIAIVLLILVLAPLILGTMPLTSYAASSPLTASAENDELSVTYVFTGEHAADAGYAEGTVVIVPKTEFSKKSYFIVCFATDTEILADYKPLAMLSCAKGATVFNVPRGVALPPQATQIAVFVYGNQNFKTDTLDHAVCVSIPESKRFAAGEETLTFASLSDIHLNYAYAAPKWLHVLETLKERNVNLIAISGDYTNDGSEDLFEVFDEQVKDSGYEGTIWAALGNHDTGSKFNYVTMMAQYGTEGKDLYFTKIAPNGDVFIFMAQDTLSEIGNSHVEDCFSNKQLDWLEGELRKYANTGKNIFIYEHAAFLNWGPGDAIPGVYVQPLNIRESNKNIMRFKALLEEYREVVMCSGHTHVAFSEMVNYNDNNGNSARLIHNSSTSQIRTYNPEKTQLIYDTNAKDSEGYIVSVYEDAIVFRGMDFHTGLFIPTACYIMESFTADHTARYGIASVEAAADSRTEYPVGYFPSNGDVKLKVTYEDGREETVTEGFTVTLYGSSYTVSPDQTGLRTTDDRLLISYGGKWTMLDITVKPDTDPLAALQGQGTAADPYIIAAANDFAALNAAWNAKPDTEFAKGLYFTQTADIDMRAAQGTVYGGTTDKNAFAGIYDGKGHTLTVSLHADKGNIAVFPRLYGTVANLKLNGVMALDIASSVSPVASVEEGGALLNCTTAVTYVGGKVSAVAPTVRGSVLAFASEDTYCGFSACAIAEKADGAAVNGLVSRTLKNDPNARTLAENEDLAAALYGDEALLASLNEAVQARGLSVERLAQSADPDFPASPDEPADEQAPLWLIITLGVILVLAAAGTVIFFVVTRKKQN